MFTCILAIPRGPEQGQDRYEMLCGEDAAVATCKCFHIKTHPGAGRPQVWDHAAKHNLPPRHRIRLSNQILWSKPQRDRAGLQHPRGWRSPWWHRPPAGDRGLPGSSDSSWSFLEMERSQLSPHTVTMCPSEAGGGGTRGTSRTSRGESQGWRDPS